MRWEKIKLGDVTDSCLGKMLDQKKNKGEFKPYLANVNVRWGEFDLNDLPQMRFEEDEDERYGLRYGDLVICEGGEPGRCALWKNQIPDMKIQKALHRVRKHDCLDFRFLYYWFLWAGRRGELEQYFTGATIKHMPGEKLKNVVIDMPVLLVQRRIADILSAYDDLIENNRKQIKLLEEAVQRIYKEWFVDLRFPGWETTEIVDGVPMGWEKVPVGDVLKKVPRTKQIQTADYLQNGNIPVIDQSKKFIAGYTNDAEAMVVPDEPIIVFGDHTRILKLITFPFAKGADGTQLVVSGELRMPQRLLYCSLVNVDLSNYHYARHFKYLKAEEILVPTSNIANAFEQIVTGIFTKIDTCREQTSKAIQARDRLLPRLMNGELEVK
ncbi:MAG: restriction endonuclease subunit S [Lachnospiraceae bacterium]|nr:restriction endonuclease subunit S [Lachnospiraceae bacterium]